MAETVIQVGRINFHCLLHPFKLMIY